MVGTAAPQADDSYIDPVIRAENRKLRGSYGGSGRLHKLPSGWVRFHEDISGGYFIAAGGAILFCASDFGRKAGLALRSRLLHRA